MVKAMVEEFGGKIWFKSTAGKGTTFYITIPKIGMTKVKGAKLLEEKA